MQSTSHLSSETLRALSCPRCAGGALDGAGGQVRCGRCGRLYPFIGRVVCLVEDPDLWRATWLARLADYGSAVETRVQALHAEAEAPDLLPRTRARVLRTAAGLAEQHQQVSALLRDLEEGGGRGAPVASAMPRRPDPRDQLLVLECYENIFRDWVWGERENEVTRALVAELFAAGLSDGPPRTLAVYGAGAGRLAVDVARTVGAAQTFALDINPLPLLVANRLLRGEVLELVELPMAAHGDTQVVLRHQVRAAAGAPDGLTFVLADAYRPPFAPGSVDAVLTSWFIDAPPVDFRVTAAAINQVLRPGGTWISCGPLRFRNELSRSYLVEEVHEIVASSGFDLGTRGRHDVPYFDSPASGARRTETVFTFVARKSAEAARPEVPASVAPWIADPRLPLPTSPALAALHRSSVFTAGVISLVDGHRSLAEIAGLLATSWGQPPTAVLDHLRAFFATLPYQR